MTPIKLVVLALTALAMIHGVALAGDAAKTKKAGGHYKQGVAFYDQGLFDEALVEFKAAYDLDPKPLMLYHMARANQGGGHADEALALYRQYLDAEASGKAADDARTQVAVIVKQLAAAPRPPPVVEPPPPPSETGPIDPPPSTPDAPSGLRPLDAPVESERPPTQPRGRRVDWRLIGVGVAAAGVGLLLDTLPGTASNAKYDALDFVPVGLYLGAAAVVYVGVF